MKEEKEQTTGMHRTLVYASFWDLPSGYRPIYGVIVACPIPNGWSPEAKEQYIKGYVAGKKQDKVRKIAEKLDLSSQHIGLSIRELSKDEWDRFVRESEENGSLSEIEMYDPYSDKKGE